MLKWRIYYGDGSTFDDAQGLPEEAPKINVQVIVQYHAEVGRWLQFTTDYYIWLGDHWLGVDQFGMWDYLFSSTGFKTALAGRTIGNELYLSLYQAAKNDPDFPEKTAYLPGEGRLD